MNNDAIALARAIGGDACPDDSYARTILEFCAGIGIDPLAHLSHRFGLTSDQVWRRAAEWAGYSFVRRPPLRALTMDGPDGLSSAEGNGVVAYYAPNFEKLLALARQRAETPALAKSICIVAPHAFDRAMGETRADELTAGARERLSGLWPRATAGRNLPISARVVFGLGLIAVILVVMASGFVARPVLVPLTAILLVGPGLLRLAAAFERPPPAASRLLNDAELPVYSVLIPLRDEAEMVAQLGRAMRALDYPPEKLDIRFIVETRSLTTVAAVEPLLDDERFRLTLVPDSLPRTKPKALDFALPLVRGDLVVVYDAEDVPAPDQLRKAASRFAADPHLACLQAELVVENAGESWLTALFAGEYAGLFGRLLPALSRWHLPVPLGGTSNHFRTGVLRELGGWDAFNVTEDADLGVRLRRRGCRVEMLDSITLEEAPVTLGAWMAQRTRWMKGWMQTYIVHNADPAGLLRDLGLRAFLGFHVLVGGMILSALLHTVFLLSVVTGLILLGPTGLLPRDLWDWVTVGVLVTGYGGALAVMTSGLLRRQAHGLLVFELLLPIYWVLHTLAATKAAWQLVVNPSYWAKTRHGVTRMRRAPIAERPGRQSSVAAKAKVRHVNVRRPPGNDVSD